MARNNQIILEEIIKAEKEALDSISTDDKFFEFYASLQCLKEYELSYEEVEAGLCGESHDGGADSIYLFVNGELVKEDEYIKNKYKKNVDIEFYIIQAKNQGSFGEEALLKWSRLSKNFFDFEFDREQFENRYSEKVIAAFELFKNTYLGLVAKKPKLKIIYLYASKGEHIHPNVRRQAEDLKKDVNGLLSDAEVKVEFIGAEILIKLTQSRPNEVFRLKLSENPMSCGEQKVFIVLTKLSELYKMITSPEGKLIKYIFESNVRDYQGKTSVNSEIQETLESEGPEEFWWLNNGVTILASDASTPGGREIVLHNPEIVNGLQTSTEIYRYFSKNIGKLETDTRNVLIRIIVSNSPEIRDKVIKATNNQTPIPKASLRATDNIHRQIEEYFKSRNLYYDRRKNYYKNDGKKPKEIISVSFLAQCLISVLKQKPDFARARPSTLLEDDDTYNKLYNKENDLSTYYFLANTGRKIELVLKESTKYGASEINDIIFYILYAVCVSLTSNLYPDNKAISKLDISMVSSELIEKMTILVYDLYKMLGGTDKVAKGSNMIESLIKELRKECAL